MKIQINKQNIQNDMGEIIRSALSEKRRRDELKNLVRIKYKEKYNKEMPHSTYHVALRRLLRDGYIEKSGGIYNRRETPSIKSTRVDLFLKQLEDETYCIESLNILHGWYQNHILSETDTKKIREALLKMLDKPFNNEVFRYIARFFIDNPDGVKNKLDMFLKLIKEGLQSPENDIYAYTQLLQKLIESDFIDKKKVIQLEELFLPLVLHDYDYGILEYFEKQMEKKGDNYLKILIGRRKEAIDEKIKKSYDKIIKRLAEI